MNDWEHQARNAQLQALTDLMKTGDAAEIRDSMRLFPEPYILVLENLIEYHSKYGDEESVEVLIESLALIKEGMVEY